MERKNISVTERHAEFISELNLQVSGILRDKLDEMIDELDWQSAEEIMEQGETKA
jgi:predicted ATPase with chaperone activity